MWVSKMFPVEAIGLGATPLKEPFNLIIRCVPGIVQSALFALYCLVLMAIGRYYSLKRLGKLLKFTQLVNGKVETALVCFHRYKPPFS